MEEINVRVGFIVGRGSMSGLGLLSEEDQCLRWIYCRKRISVRVGFIRKISMSGLGLFGRGSISWLGLLSEEDQCQGWVYSEENQCQGWVYSEKDQCQGWGLFKEVQNGAMPVFYYPEVQQCFCFAVGKSSEALVLLPEGRATLRFYCVEVEQCLDFTVEEQCYVFDCPAVGQCPFFSPEESIGVSLTGNAAMLCFRWLSNAWNLPF